MPTFKARYSKPVIPVKSSKVAEFDAWMAKYEPEERAIFEARERRAINREKRAWERYRRLGDLCEATEGHAKVWTRLGVSYEDMLEFVKDDPWALQCFLRYARVAVSKRIKCLSDAARRPLYYERENARRQALAAERRKISRRHTINPRPTREQILDAWIHRRDSHDAALRFGSIIMDLECFLDNSLLFSENGAICGRRGGVKRWLQEEIPALYLRYTTVMRFKAMAKKVRQIVELDDPTPAIAVLAGQCGCGDNTECHEKGDSVAEKNSVDGVKQVGHAIEYAFTPEKSGKVGEVTSGNAVEEKKTQTGTGDKELNFQDELRILRARAIWLEVIADIGRTPTALMARVDALLDPENVDEANMLAQWRSKYVNEITLRRKFGWRRRLFGSRRTRCT